MPFPVFMIRSWRTILSGCALVLLLTGCAIIGSPTGGDKDTTPPSFLEGKPKNGSVAFDGKEIVLSFDEYIVLESPQNEVVFSPPMKNRQDIRVLGRDIQIRLNNDLLPNTTYSVNFGMALKDNNEKNPLPDFEYVFSTGNALDTLAVIGSIHKAFSLNPPEKEETFLVMLYSNLSDSAPLLQLPNYLGKVSKIGRFAINNIPSDTFRVFALKDENNNLKYDKKTEWIAFLDSFLVVNPGNVKGITFMKDTVKIVKAVKTKDKSKSFQPADTSIAEGKRFSALNISLACFQEEDFSVALHDRIRETAEKLVFTFSRPPLDSVRIVSLGEPSSESWCIREESVNKDSITCWITDTLISRQDSLAFTVSYGSIDSAGFSVEKTDTVLLRFRLAQKDEKETRKKRSEITLASKPRMTITSSIKNGGIQDLNKSIALKTERPLAFIHADSIDFYYLQDSTMIKQPFTAKMDSTNIRSFSISTNWIEDCNYRVLLKPGCVFDIYGITNDSLVLSFNTRKTDYYGRILVSVGSKQFPVILQLLDNKEAVLQYKYLNHEELVVFDFLSPGRYTLKAIIDENFNGKWDTGDFFKHLQPEKVFIYHMPKELRSNWDNEVSWQISD
jgi:hypothetical protein